MIRRAVVTDVPTIGKIVNDCAEYGLMLHRSLSFLYEHVRDFVVATDKSNAVIGVCGLSIVWANLAEVYSLAVVPPQRGKGLGKQLLAACVEEARRLGVPRLMTLTYEERFFSASGFEVIDRQQLPLKVWSECLRCAKNQACDEIAMVRVLSDVPTPAAPLPAPPLPPHDQYVVPVELEISTRRMDRRPKMDESPSAATPSQKSHPLTPS